MADIPSTIAPTQLTVVSRPAELPPERPKETSRKYWAGFWALQIWLLIGFGDVAWSIYRDPALGRSAMDWAAKNFDAPLCTLALLAFLSLHALVSSLRADIEKEVESDIGVRGTWSGFGGGRGGWQMSRQLTMVMLTVLFGLAFAVVAGLRFQTSAKPSKPEAVACCRTK